MTSGDLDALFDGPLDDAPARGPVRWVRVLPYVPMLAVTWLMGAMARSSHLLTRDLTPVQPDIAETILRVEAATRLHAYTGAYSRYGWQHPGPAYFYLLAPFHALMGGRVAGLAVGTAVLHVAALIATVVVVHRAWGTVAATATSLSLSLWVVRYGPDHLFQMWNPLLTSTWTILFLVAAAATISGLDRDRWKGPFVVACVVGSVLVQAHVGTATMVVLVLGTVFVRSARTVFAARRRPVFVAVLVVSGTLLWAPVAVDQVSGLHNVTALARYFVLGQELDTPFAFAEGATQQRQPASETVPRGAAVLSLRLHNIGGLSGADLLPSSEVEGSPVDGVLLAGLVAANVALAWTQRARRRPVAVLARITLLATGASALSLVLLRGPGFDLYQVHYLTGVGFWLWATPTVFALGWVADRVRSRTPGTLVARAAPVAAAVAVAAAAVVFVATTDRSIPLFTVDHDSPARIVLAARPDLERVNLSVGPDLHSIMLTTTRELNRAGVEVGLDRYWRKVVSAEHQRVLCVAPTVSIARAAEADLRPGAVLATTVIGIYTHGNDRLRVDLLPPTC